MFNSSKRLPGNRKYRFGWILVLLIAMIGLAFMTAGNDDFDIARREVLLRKIGDELLLQSGDSTSRVLPVNKIAEHEYQIRFEHELTFQPATLVSTTTHLLARDPLAEDYVVNVVNCNNASIAYGYAISNNTVDDLVPCKGRAQPRGCYMINITFKPAGISMANKGYLLAGIPLLAFVGFFFLRSAKPKSTLPIAPNSQDTNSLSFGAVLFNAEKRQLIIQEHAIDLTATEIRLLLIFALSPNETIARTRLQKEIWEDEGVIVGRSLDMFISKLRKKLEPDPGSNIVVVRGKGYRLETSA